ncbi:neck protein [Escherichia phage vB_EcoM_005]|nr:neck protein [Escherichia phage vB_EcoM_005]AZV00953.1 neck protein [Escherichia phage vB_EcoM_005]WQZ01089.1 neck protein [Escherichia phage 04086]
MPVKNIDGLADISDIQYEEVNEINAEAAEFVHPYVVINGRGEDAPPTAFDDAFLDD